MNLKVLPASCRHSDPESLPARRRQHLASRFMAPMRSRLLEVEAVP